MTYPSFSPGDVLGAADMNAVGLWKITSQTIGSAVSSVTLSDVFSADYDSYRVKVSGGAASTNLDLRLTLGGTSTGYYYGQFYVAFSSGNTNAVNGNNTSYIPVGSGGTTSLNASFDIISPFLAEQTIVSSSVYFASQGGSGFSNGFLDNTTSYTAFTLTCSTGNMTGGTVKVYGYRN